MPRITFASSPTGQLEAAAQGKFAFVTQAAAIILTTGAALKAIGNTNGPFVSFPENDGLQFRFNKANSVTFSLLGARTQNGFSAIACTFNPTLLGDDEVIAIRFTHVVTPNPAVTLFCAVTKMDGTVVTSGSIRLPGLNMPGTSPRIVVWNVATSFTILALAVFSAAPASDYLSPVGDPNLVALYYMGDNGSGAVNDEVSGGTALTVTSGAFNTTPDPWDPSGAQSNAPRSLRYHLSSINR